MHEERSMAVELELSFEQEKMFELLINKVHFDKLPEAPERERQPICRTKTSINIQGQKM